MTRLYMCHKREEVINTNEYKIAIWFHSDKANSGKGFIANITWGECKYIYVVLISLN